MTGRLDFQAIAQSALRSAYYLVPNWLPAGRSAGVEWVCGGVKGETGESCSINLTTGKWADFATGEKGGDLVSLLAAIRGVGQGEAAKMLDADLGVWLTDERPAPKPAANPDDEWTVVRPAPDDLDFAWCLTMRDLGKAVAHWEYRDDDGRLHLVVARWNKPNGDKDIRAFSCWRHTVTGEVRWRCKHLPKPRPLYGIDRLSAKPDALVVVVEGEKTADAVEARFPYVVAVTTEGGSTSAPHSDWSPLEGRRVIIWPDNDAPGNRYASQAIHELEKVGANVVSVVNHALLARELDSELPAGHDCADIPIGYVVDLDKITIPHVRETKTNKTAPTPDTGAGAPPSTRPARCINGEFAALATACREYLADRGLAPDSLDGWREVQTWKLVREDLSELARDAWFDLSMHGFDVAKTTIQDVLETIASEQREKRRTDLIASLVTGPATAEGDAALRTFVRALTAREDEWEVAVVRHWIWMVKRQAIGEPIQHHLMPVVFGPQGSGKSQAVNRLCQPWSELSIQVNASYLTDDRRCPVLASAVCAIWDEMQGSAKADIEALKNTITSGTISYRPMRTTQTVVQPRTCSFIGTSNLPVDVMVPDTTGARRFVQLTTPERCDWSLINEVLPDLIWQSIAFDDAPPILPYLDRLREHQQTLIHQDPVNLWLESETWGSAIVVYSHKPEPLGIPAYRHDVGEDLDTMLARFRAWCLTVGQAPMPSNRFATRLAQEGFTKDRPRTNGCRRRMYRRPINAEIEQQQEASDAIGF